MNAPAHTYARRLSPFLPLSEGRFAFLHTSSDGRRDVTVQRLEPRALGHLPLPSGQLVVADPFVGMHWEGNRTVALPPGDYAVWQTLAHVEELKEGVRPRAAFLSLVLRPDLLAERQAWQQQQIRNGHDPSLPETALSLLHLTAHGQPLEGWEVAPHERLEAVSADIQSGTAAFLDRDGLRAGMPPDTVVPGQGWYDRYFEPGAPESWFDRIDSEEDHAPGAANFALPLDPQARIAMSQSGWGDGAYPVVGEYAFTPTGAGMRRVHPEQLVAVHLDFRVVPRNPRRSPFPVTWGTS
jgi:hypothetical protein